MSGSSTSTKYATSYRDSASNGNKSYITGDAIGEVSVDSSILWFQDSWQPYDSGYPFFQRGRGATDVYMAGLFASYSYQAPGDMFCGFRVVCTFSGCDHEYSEWVVEKEASCDAKGLRHSTCTKCGQETTQETPTVPHTIINRRLFYVRGGKNTNY